MEPENFPNSGTVNSTFEEDSSAVALNSSVLNYYKKFGRKSNIEQYFSLSTAHSEIRDPTSLFWRRMKTQSDSSDSAEKKSESSAELCRISIKCSIPEHSSSQEENPKTKDDSESPPIITEDILQPIVSAQSDNESVKSEEDNSAKSADATLDTSMNKPFSPTSSITSQRKLEWDSLADVGYGNESERKTSASSLSTLERLALKQQYSNNDSKQNSHLTEPTAHSTPTEESVTKSKGKKGPLKKTRIYQKDTDFVEVNMPQTSNANPSPAINVNLTKHISFNVEKDGGVTVEKIKKDLVVSPDKVPSNNEKEIKSDKEIQTSLTKKRDGRVGPISSCSLPCGKGISVLMNLNSLKNRNRRRKLKTVKKRNKSRIPKKFDVNKENISVQEKSGEQVSEAESFEYMPGHIYNQNHMYDNSNQSRSINADNKSSLESSGAMTTDSSKNSRLSFTKDLETNIDLIRKALEKRSSDINLKKRLIEGMVKRLLDTKYKDDTGFLKEITSENLTLPENTYTTTSTSEANNSGSKSQIKRPNKSILRRDKLNPNLPSTSQIAPNLPIESKNEIAVLPNVNRLLTSSNTESDLSSKEKSSSDTPFAKTSSQELYQKYLAALRREEEYKKHLKEKETFLRQKQISSDTAINLPPYVDAKTGSRLNDLMKDLTRNNYDDGSGDASKLEGGTTANFDLDRYRVIRKQRRHSVFTLSSGNSDNEKKTDLRKRIQCEIKKPYKASTSKDGDHYCCCPFHLACVKPGVTDSSVQVNLKQNEPVSAIKSDANKISHRKMPRVVSDDVTEEFKYLCVAAENGKALQEVPENFLIYKCSRLTNRGVQLEEQTKSNAMVQCNKDCSCMQKFKDSSLSHSSSSKDKDHKHFGLTHKGKSNSSDNIIELMSTKSSQTELDLFPRKSSVSSVTSCEANCKYVYSDCARKTKGATKNELNKHDKKKYVMQATRWIQTEISIEPKLSDPSVSDIKMINDDDCVKLISEQCNEVFDTDSKSSSSRYQQSTNDKIPNVMETPDYKINLSRPSARGEVKRKDKTFKDVHTCYNKTGLNVVDMPGKEDCIVSTKKVNQAGFSSDYSERSNSEKKPETSKGEQTEAEKFTIPIQGTNMTLKVSIGTNKPEIQTEKKNNETQVCCEMVTQGVGTNKLDSVEKATFLTGDCGRVMQSHGTDTSRLNRNKIIQTLDEVSEGKKEIKETSVGVSANTCVANACVTKEGFKFNTYPNNVHIKERKSIIRSNTDTAIDRFMLNSNEQNYNIQTDCVKVVDIGVQNERPIEQTNSAKISRNTTDSTQSTCSKRCSDHSSKNITKVVSEGEQVQTSKSGSENGSGFTINNNDPIMEMIQTITKRYSKKKTGRSDKKKCFKEIMALLKYLLDTEDNTDQDKGRTTESSVHDTDCDCRAHTKGKLGDFSEQNRVNFVNGKESCDSNKVGTSKLTKEERIGNACEVKELVDKGVQSPCRTAKTIMFSNTESSDIPISTDIPGTSSDSITCKVLNTIKRECEKYHQKRCKTYSGSRKYDMSSSTSVNCDNCKRVHYCHCRGHKCKNFRPKVTAEKFKRDCIAYNLIIQTSDSMVSDDVGNRKHQPLQNIVIKVPKRKTAAHDSCKAAQAKEIPTNCGPQIGTRIRSKSLPNEEDISELKDCRSSQGYTVRDYLERNRPDFIEKTSNRQKCLRFISESREGDQCNVPNLKMIVVHSPKCQGNMDPCNAQCGGVSMNYCNPHVDMCTMAHNEVFNIGECVVCLSTHFTRANERTIKRELLSLQLEQQPTVKAVSASELRHLAEELGVELRRKRLKPKFISERDMKKHSERIYKSLPEVQRKKEEAKKENIKKTNLLMASIFKKNLQKKTLGGNVNLSNYSSIIKI